ncbi:hypothetical protein VTJ83DRAFT_5165 [Remersonia thermophila]|uniref:F-box domain-containing protein n=1 Tax=Remersonia thermophila TaxID=72144 RepID=A0ABR4DC28_9PEZI
MTRPPSPSQRRRPSPPPPPSPPPLSSSSSLLPTTTTTTTSSSSSSHLLHALPTELLLFVINNLTRVQDVASLARTSRRLYGMCNPYLYRRAAETNDARPLAWAANRGLVSTLQLALTAGLDPNHEFVEDISYQEWTAVATAARQDAAAGREKQRWGMWDFNNRPDPFRDHDRRPPPAAVSKGVSGPSPPQQPPGPVPVGERTAIPFWPPSPPVGKRRFYAMHLAARSGHLDVLDVLLRHNAAVDVRSVRFCACTPQRGLLNALEHPEDDEAEYEDEDLAVGHMHHHHHHDHPYHHHHHQQQQQQQQQRPGSGPGPGPAPGRWTPLHVAICHGQTEAARLLLGRGKATPLMETVADGATAAASELASAGSARQLCYGATALHHAAAFGLASLAAHLLDARVVPDVDARDDRSLTPLYHAYAARRWDTTVPLLLARGADINHAVNMYIPYTAITPLGEACRLGDFAVADRLVALGADVSKGCLTYTKPGCLTPLHLACMRSAVAPSHHVAAAPGKNSSGDNNNNNNNNNNPYHKNGAADTPDRGEARMRTIGRLIARGAPLDARDCFGSTPLMAAVQARNAFAIEALRRHGAGPEQADPRDMEVARARLRESEGDEDGEAGDEDEDDDGEDSALDMAAASTSTNASTSTSTSTSTAAAAAAAAAAAT